MPTLDHTVDTTDFHTDDSRQRRKRLVIILLLLLLLLAFMLSVLAWVLFVTPSQPIKKGKFEFLFSIYGLTRPMDVATDEEGNIFVSNNGTSEILRYDKDGDFLGSFSGTKRAEKIYANDGVHIDGNRIYVADFTAGQIRVFSLSGKVIRRFPDRTPVRDYGPKGFTPFGVAGYKNKIFVTSNNGVYIFSKKGKLLSSWSGHRGLKRNEYDFPNGIAIDDRDGTVYVADVLNRRVKALDQNGKLKWIAGIPNKKGRVKSIFMLPRGLAINKERNYIYVVDTFADKIIVLDKNGKLISMLGERGTDDGQFNFPEGLTYVGDDVFLIADRENGRVQKLKVGQFPPAAKVDIEKYEKAFVSYSEK